MTTQNLEILNKIGEENSISENENELKNTEILNKDFLDNSINDAKKSDDELNKNSDELNKILSKNKELLDKLAKVKNENKNLLSENESLKNIQEQFNNYKQAEYWEAILYNVLDAIPSSKEYVKFELQRMGYQVIFDKEKQAYCFINKKNELVDKNEIYEMKKKFANYVYGSQASGSGLGHIDPHFNAKQLCKLENGVFVGKPQIKAQANMMAKFYQSELEKAQKAVEYYSREIPALLATVDSLPNQILSDDDKLHFGLK